MNDARFGQAMAAFDAVHARDPRVDRDDNETVPYELLYARRMTRELERLRPDAGEALRLAVRAQHLERWAVPRDQYPRDRSGYKRWRLDLANRHAERAGEILEHCGYDVATVRAVQGMLRKEQLKRDADVQTLEDVACLVFLRHYFADFSREHPREKLIGILRKTWNKMSDRGHAAALEIDLPPEAAELVREALADGTH